MTPVEGRRSNGSSVRAQTIRWTDGHYQVLYLLCCMVDKKALFLPILTSHCSLPGAQLLITLRFNEAASAKSPLGGMRERYVH